MIDHQINDAGYHIEESDPRPEFLLMKPYLKGLGLDWGCGTNRLSPTVLSVDHYPHKDADLVWDILKKPFPFADNVFDFIFTSHCIEDMPPYRIQFCFDELLRVTKKGGYVVIIVPDIEGKRYPDIDEVFTAEDEEVKNGSRKIGSLKGNPSHLVRMGGTLLNELQSKSKYESEVVQKDTIPHSTMSLDFIIRKQ